jgi:AAA15 family ATPase/GTPase
MILSFTVENFRSIRERQSLIFEASADSHLEDSHVIKRDGHKVLKSTVVYGANASGKSNIINAMIWMRRFVLESISEKVENPTIPVEPFRLNTESRNAPSVFELEFMLADIRYRYGFALTSSGIEEEWLYRKGKKGATAKVFTREKQDIVVNKRQEKGLEPFILRTRPNTLFLKVCAEFNFGFAEWIMEWFRHFRYVSGLDEKGFIGFTAERLGEAVHRKRIMEFIRKADFNLCGIRSEFEPMTEKDLPENMPSELRNKFLKGNPMIGDILTSHNVYDSNGEVSGQEEFDLEEDESQGTKKFVALAGPILHTIEEGSILLVDEFEARLHPNLTKAILQWFNGPQNKNGAQLIIATHDTGLMDPDLLRRDQIWFCEKDRRGSTSLYCLDEFDKQEVRASTKFNRQYLQGIFGAVPQVALDEYLTSA